MSVNDAPAGETGGLFSVSDLPEKLRVHALAKLIGRTSKEVLAALAELGSPVGSAQSGVDRKTAEQVVTSLLGAPGTAAETAPGTAAEAGEDPASPVPSQAEAAAAPAPAPARTRRRKAAAAAPAETAETPETGAAESDAGEPAQEQAEAPARRTRRKATRKAGAPAEQAESAPAPITAAAPSTADGTEAPTVADTTAADATVTDAPAPAPAKRTRRKATRKAGAPDEQAELTTTGTPTGTGAESALAEPTTGPATGSATVPADTGLSPLFAPPAPLFKPAEPTRTRRRGRADDQAEDTAAAESTGTADEPAEETERPRRRRRGRAAAQDETEQPDDTADTTEATESADATDATDADSDDDEDDEAGGRRRRRRGRRGRGRGRGENGEDGAEGGEDTESAETGGADDSSDADDSDDSDDSDEEQDSADEGGSRRRRRRRRRKGSGDAGDSSADGSDDDPPNTVTRVRTPRERDTGDDGVQSVRGSTRLEAKRQRRRDGRDAGRRRPPILSESEFLARRESVERTMVIRQTGKRNEIGVLEDGVLVEHFIAGGSGQSESMVGNIYLGRVQNVLPSMEAAFVDIGRGRNAVLYAGEVDWDAAGLNGKARRIEQALSSGDSVLVQVTKDPVGHKGARLTTQISLAGRFLVYVPSGGAAGISRKLPDVERKRLKDMLKEIVPSDAGVIIRTASEGVSHEALERDVRRLQAQWEVVKEKAAKTGPKAPKAPTLLYEEPDLLVKVVRDQFNEDFASLVVSGDSAWETVSDYVSHVAPELAERMHRHVGPKDVFAEYRIDEQLLKALDRKVWLPSGGTLVIDRTEAMTVVDVNTGKFTGSGGNLEETVTRNNLEAAEEVVRQLRLRDIGGIIVVDFIDMVLEANRDLVLRRLTECLARDRTRHQVAEVTSLGLVQMTRKRVGGGLLEHFSTTCEHCRGRGVIVNVDGVEPKHDHGQNGSGNGHQGNGQAGGQADNGGRRRNRRGRDDKSAVETETETDERASAAAALAMVAAAAGHTAVADPAPVTDAPEAPVGMDEPDTGRPARRRGRRRVERPAGGTGSAEPVVVTTEAAESVVAEAVAPQGGTAAAAPEATTADTTADTAAEAPAEAVAVEAVATEEVAADVATEVVADAVAPQIAPEAVEEQSEQAGQAEQTGQAGQAAVTGEPATGLPANGTPLVAADRVAADTAEATATDTAEDTAEDSAAPVETPAEPAETPEEAPAPRRRRGRVTRSAGAPSAAAEPVVLTAPAVEPAEPLVPAVAEQSDTAVDTVVVSRPRRSRRAASRPAGPPAEGDGAAVTVTVGAPEQASDQGGDQTGDPV